MGTLSHPFRIIDGRIIQAQGQQDCEVLVKESRVVVEKAAASGSDLVDLIMQQVQQLKQETDGQAGRDGEPEPPAVLETLAEIISSPSQPVAQDWKSLIEQGNLVPAPLIARPGNPNLIAATNLEAAITQTIRKRVPGCASFVGVIVQQTTPKSRFDANWALRGVKFGKADRKNANEAIATIVERMQREFRLSDDDD